MKPTNVILIVIYIFGLIYTSKSIYNWIQNDVERPYSGIIINKESEDHFGKNGNYSSTDHIFIIKFDSLGIRSVNMNVANFYTFNRGQRILIWYSINQIKGNIIEGVIPILLFLFKLGIFITTIILVIYFMIRRIFNDPKYN
jgi:hypothetical protein